MEDGSEERFLLDPFSTTAPSYMSLLGLGGYQAPRSINRPAGEANPERHQRL